MKVTELPSAIFKPIGLALVMLAAGSAAHAQLEPVWTINHGQALPAATVRNEYYNNLGFFGVPIVQETATIDFNWGLFSPAASIPVDSFTARWTGSIMPTFTELYTFSATAAGGVRIWVDNELILNQWFEHAESESVGFRELEAGSVYNLRVEFFESTGTASIRLQWSSSSMPKQLVRFQNSPDGTAAQFGSVLAGSGNGRLFVGPRRLRP
jgi:hypothetical protein